MKRGSLNSVVAPVDAQLRLDPKAGSSYRLGPMCKKYRCIAVVALLFASLSAFAAEVLPLAPTEGVLVLKRGDVFNGTVSVLGDYYFLSLPERDIRVKTSDVEMFCTSLDDAYERKRAQIAPNDADTRLELAQWCISHKLYGSAAREILEVRRIQPDHPKLKLMENRLEVARDRRSVEPASSAPAESIAVNLELDQLAKGMPPGAVEAFSQSIQPMLLNSCSSSNCHHANADNSFRLIRVAPRFGAARRDTLRNLQSALQAVRPADISNESALMVHATRQHGGAKSAPLTARDIAKIRQLAAWVEVVSNAANRNVPSPPGLLAERRALEKAAPLPTNAARIKDGEVKRATFETQRTDKPDAPPSIQETAPDSVDALDPEIFNRRFQETELPPEPLDTASP